MADVPPNDLLPQSQRLQAENWKPQAKNIEPGKSKLNCLVVVQEHGFGRSTEKKKGLNASLKSANKRASFWLQVGSDTWG